jgi:hypothetical protein
MLKLYQGPKELKPSGPSYKQKPLRLRPGERAVTASGEQVVILRDYGSKEDKRLPYLIGCCCDSHENEPCEMRRLARDSLVSLDYPLQDKAIKGEIEFSLRHDDVTDKLEFTPHLLDKVKDMTRKYSVRISLKVAKALDADGKPLSTSKLELEADDKTFWPENTDPLELFHVMSDDLADETLFVEVFMEQSFSKSFVGGVAIMLNGLDLKAIDHQRYAIAKDYKEFAVQVGEVVDEEIFESNSSYGFSTQLPPEITAYIDTRFMAVGPPDFAGPLWDWRATLATIKGAWLTHCKTFKRDKKSAYVLC